MLSKQNPQTFFWCKSYAKTKDVTPPRKYSQSLLILTNQFRIVNSQQNSGTCLWKQGEKKGWIKSVLVCLK